MEDIKQIIQKRCPQRPIEEFELIMDTIQKFELNKEKVTITKVAEVTSSLSRNQVAARIKVLEELKLIKIRRSLTGKRPVFLYIDGKSISNDRNEKIEIKLKVLLSEIKTANNFKPSKKTNQFIAKIKEAIKKGIVNMSCCDYFNEIIKELNKYIKKTFIPMRKGSLANPIFLTPLGEKFIEESKTESISQEDVSSGIKI